MIKDALIVVLAVIAAFVTYGLVASYVGVHGSGVWDLI
jgi:hypothetical protein